MKRFILSLLAMCTLVSCSSGISENPYISEPVEEIPAEPVFMEYNAEDFREIDVKLNKQSGKAPVELKEYDISAAFEPVMSPCKADAEFKVMTSYGFPDECTDEQRRRIEDLNKQQEQKEREEFNNICENPYSGRVDTSVICGDSFYFVVNYDNLCYAHCFKIWKFDMVTHETTMLYEYSDNEEDYSISGINYVNGSLWLSGRGRDSKFGSIYRLDEEKNTLERLPFESGFDHIYLVNSCSDRLVLLKTSYLRNDNEYTLCEYNFETEQWDEFYCGDKAMKVIDKDVFVSEGDGKKVSVTLQDRFQLNTNLRATELVGISENRVSFLTSDSISTILYTYDVEKMERYKIDLTSLGSYFNVYNIGENLFITNLLGKLNMYLIPELGTAFNLESSLYGFYSSGSKIWTTNAQAKTEEQIIQELQNGITVCFDAENTESKLYVIE